MKAVDIDTTNKYSNLLSEYTAVQLFQGEVTSAYVLVILCAILCVSLCVTLCVILCVILCVSFCVNLASFNVCTSTLSEAPHTVPHLLGSLEARALMGWPTPT
jgi:hypothetical protein